MSHFTVIVIGPDIEAQLQPYHEFECTGTNDQYVVDVDVTDEIRSEFAKGSRTYYVLPDGRRVTCDDPALYREFTDDERREEPHPMGSMYSSKMSYESRDWGDGQGYRAKVFDPKAAGATAIEVPCVECMTLLEYIEYARGEMPTVGPFQSPDTDGEHKHGYVIVDSSNNVVSVINRTNPNKRWDWWVVGGRWTGFFPVKAGAKNVVALGKRSMLGRAARPETADVIRAGDVDFDRARSEASANANALFDAWESIFTKHGKAESWAECRTRFGKNYGAARTAYNDHPTIKATRAHDELRWMSPVDDLGYDREAYVAKCVNRALVPYAIVKDGKWYAKGTMGFWGISRDAMTQDEWNEQVQRLYADLPPDTLLTIVDCHI